MSRTVAAKPPLVTSSAATALVAEGALARIATLPEVSA